MSDKQTTKNLLKNNTCETCLYVGYLEDGESTYLKDEKGNAIQRCAMGETLDPRVNPANVRFATPWLNSCRYWTKRRN
jgi:hypothetical protein